jgi:hypothetical protein
MLEKLFWLGHSTVRIYGDIVGSLALAKKFKEY